MKPGIILCIGTQEELERVASWLIANGANPNLIPRSSRIIVTGTGIIVDELIQHQHPRGGKRLARYKYQVAKQRNRLGNQHLRTRKRAFRLRIDLKDIK